ncbi:MAG: SH3 domain-containing protein [Lachnospiraceae bacterium]|nr:SH3 domain-containing protein [Lachnospiraceae bacterium]
MASKGSNKGSYDDKIEAMLVARRRKAERKKMQRQKELQKIYTIIACGALVFLLLVVILIKGCSHDSGKKKTKEKETTTVPVTTVVETTTAAEETTTEESNDVAGKVMYTTDTLNFRQEASVESELLMHIPPNTPVTVLSSDGEWCNISYNDISGYVKLEFLREGTSEDETIETSEEQGEISGDEVVTTSENSDTEEINISDDEEDDDDDVLIENMDGDEEI